MFRSRWFTHSGVFWMFSSVFDTSRKLLPCHPDRFFTVAFLLAAALGSACLANDRTLCLVYIYRSLVASTDGTVRSRRTRDSSTPHAQRCTRASGGASAFVACLDTLLQHTEHGESDHDTMPTAAAQPAAAAAAAIAPSAPAAAVARALLRRRAHVQPAARGARSCRDHHRCVRRVKLVVLTRAMQPGTSPGSGYCK
jgi:hypothetical protein